ncbi:S8 family serine peptidase [Candidatus Uhrbacteria bacterium]|nr:S8 family serine peptidase [Candidatus Uhrbacteria bacterium]MBD3284009.1 S8 family serine peptidase [Candidatus Uhrbacteria bacterium]
MLNFADMNRRFHSLIIVCSLMVLAFAPSAQAFVPNDPYYDEQWYLTKIGMEEAWEETTGSPSVVVAVIDTGIDIYHEDLAQNMWSNTGEIPGNQLDDDQNGFIDDVQGWNFVLQNNDVRPWGDALTDEALIHGTLVASIIAARGNNGLGIAGISWEAKIMSLVALNEEGVGDTADVANAVYYAVQNGADIINLSIEGSIDDVQFDEALAYARANGVLVVTAAGNAELVEGADLSLSPVYPACSGESDIFGVLAVTGTDARDRKAQYANYGSCVDISAPSQPIFAARPIERGPHGVMIAPAYAGGYSGTSLAVPVVSGLAALLKSKYPNWGVTELRERIMQTAEPIDDLNDRRFIGGLGSGRLNAALALSDRYQPEEVTQLELQATLPGQPTRVRLLTPTEMITVAPFGTEDLRGAHVAFTDPDQDGIPEIAVVPASGTIPEWVLLGRDGQFRSQGLFPGPITDGALVAGVHDGFVIADPNGGNAWGIDGQETVHPILPYGPDYHLGLDLLEIDNEAAFAPRMSGGRLVITNVRGEQLVSAFPFGVETVGRWAVAKMLRPDGMYLVFSGTAGTKALHHKSLGQTGWEAVSFELLEQSPLILSSGRYTEELSVKQYDSWPH